MRFINLYLLRLINCFLINSYYAPDEFWQAQEIAHSDVFGYGYRTWEWTRENPLRSPVFHSFYSILYSLLKYLSWDSQELIQFGPKFLNAFWGALFDYFLIQVTSQLQGSREDQKSFGLDFKHLILLVNYSCWFSCFAFPRSLINSIESVLFTAILNYDLQEKLLESRLLLAFSFLLRPTSIIPWVFYLPYKWICKIPKGQKKNFFLNSVYTVLGMATASFIIDSLYYKKFSSTALNFLLFNFIEGESSLYGVHNPFWYFTQGIPYILAGWVTFFFIGACYYNFEKKKHFSKDINLNIFLFFPLAILSISKHKEDRFLLPYISIYLIFVAYGITIVQKACLSNRKYKIILYSLLSIAVLTNISLFNLQNFFHNQASIPATKYLAQQIQNQLKNQNQNLNQQNNISIAFFTECHQTPFYSFVHNNVNLLFPECEPQNRKTNSTQSLLLFTETQKYFSQIIQQNQPLLFLIYDGLVPKIQELINSYKYVQLKCFWHSFFMETPMGNIFNVSFCIYKKM